MENIINTLTDYLVDKIPGAKINIQENIIEKGVIDSYGIIEFIGFIEKKYDLEFNDDELTSENFEFIASIAKLINTKMA
jgi:acyl carrier protein|tara:strand:- start:503 stop:739 length:237 start_codon:yes stop_codon:yes gene_type:complete